MLPDFNDLSDEQLVALSDEEIRFYEDMACAENGTPLLPPDPGPEPKKHGYSPDRTVYRIPEYAYSGTIVVEKAEDAARICALVNEIGRVDLQYRGGGSEYVISTTDDTIEAKPVQCYSRELWDKAKSEIESYESRKKSWQDAKSALDKAAKARSDTVAYIHEAIGEARDREWNRKRYADALTRYIELANGDEATARRFLLNAHPDADKYLPQVEGA